MQTQLNNPSPLKQLDKGREKYFRDLKKMINQWHVSKLLEEYRKALESRKRIL
jgi:hypothetical protein